MQVNKRSVIQVSGASWHNPPSCAMWIYSSFFSFLFFHSNSAARHSAMRQLNWQVSISTPVPDIETLKNTLMKKLGLWCRNWGLWNWDPKEDIVTLKLRPWWRNWDSEEEIGTLMKKSGPWWRKWDSYEEIGTLMKKLGLWWRHIQPWFISLSAAVCRRHWWLLH